MKKIRWAIIGAGGIADRRAIPALLEDEQNQIVAIMSRKPDVAEAIAKKYGVEKYFSDEEEMFKAVPCDAVYIGTPVFCHYRQAMLALKYGVNVFMEKPIAMNRQEAQELLDAFRAAGKQLTIGYMMGYHNLHRKAAQIIAEGGVGQISLVNMQFSCWYPEIPGAWRQEKALGGGGCIMDLAVHCMELFESITGDSIAKVTAMFTTRTFSYEVEDVATITFRSEGGIMGHIDVNFNVSDAVSARKMEIYGTAGSLIAEGTLGQLERGTLAHTYAPQGAYNAQQDGGKSTQTQVYEGEDGNIYTKQFCSFNDLLLAGKCDYANAERAVKIQKLCDQIYENNDYLL